MAFSNGLDLTKSSLERFIDAANYKRSWFLLNTEDDGEWKANAVLKSVTPVSNRPGVTAVAKFEVDREANNVPYNFVKPKQRYFTRSIDIRQITAQEIIDKWAIAGTLYAGKLSNIKTTKQLAAPLSKVTGLTISESDILDQQIPNNAGCIFVQFAPSSLNYIGTMRVDIVTPVTDGAAGV